ncbi:ExbD/TolR family protein [Agarilytica rhodophyticola]|uniref:ExbD/TolR family protein n=1 Tax=Agarilytica rhodophyticola TaxID=1737490 RepID=UPI000B349ECD|nr:biopolymer transporter ExbD [Agarilytica rhodophyticola]
MKLGRKRKRMETTVELNITAFMNLMVILVPFLLITAVFSRMTVLELNLPALDAKAEEKENPKVDLQLQVLITKDTLIVQDPNVGPFKTIARNDNGAPFDDIQRKVWKPFGEILLTLKTRFPEKQNIALLMDRGVSYKTMIAVMDRVRSIDVVQAASLETVVLFPQVSIGDIPQFEEAVDEQSSDQGGGQ